MKNRNKKQIRRGRKGKKREESEKKRKRKRTKRTDKNSKKRQDKKRKQGREKRKQFSCAAGVVTKTTDRDRLRYTYNGTRRVRQLALGCKSNWVKSTHDAYENTWKCGELKLYFSPSAGG